MAEHTGIEWTDSTFNPWWGCTKIAPACDNCYAAALDKRTGGNHWGNVERRRTGASNWQQPRRWQKQAGDFLAARGRKRRVFCASMADVFDNQVPSEWRDDLWTLIRACPDLDWQLLTKRPQNIAKMLPAFWDEVRGHVWLGTTVEDQEHADQNIPHLIKHDSAVRFLSCEPLLGPISLRWPAWHEWPRARPVTEYDGSRSIDWIIAGGESGAGARNPEGLEAWFLQLRDQCADLGIPFNFKQWGDHDRHGHRVGKKVAGRMLDGRTWDGFPLAA